ncbi:MAG: SulP family inorganic anion transporter, partial [Bacteroidetes bacterium]
MRRKIRYYRLLWLKYDLPAGLSVFLVALPLCLGIALASGAPLYAGILSGIIGGIVVSFISGSQLSVSGP